MQNKNEEDGTIRGSKSKKSISVEIFSYTFTDCIIFFKTNRNKYKNEFICSVNRKKCFQIL